jgi:branched-chain amino acid transport system ATP-binding protein
VAAVVAVTPLLETAGLTRTFGGLHAVRSVDFRVGRGEIRAIIGPNGAGKTTLVSMICGRVVPTSGRIVFRGRDITRLPAHARAGLGIVYTFQVINVFRRLSVYENVALPAQRRLLRGLRSRLAPAREAVAGRVDAILEEVGLRGAAGRPAASLPYGHQRLLEIAMAVALQPALLVLDEPTQGLAAEEIAAVAVLLRRIAGEATVLLIEHNMQVVLDLSERITVMDGGRIIAEGTPDEIEADRNVQRVYLGR